MLEGQSVIVSKLRVHCDDVDRMVVVTKVLLVGVSVSMYRSTVFCISRICQIESVRADSRQSLRLIEAKESVCNRTNQTQPGLQL